MSKVLRRFTMCACETDHDYDDDQASFSVIVRHVGLAKLGASNDVRFNLIKVPEEYTTSYKSIVAILAPTSIPSLDHPRERACDTCVSICS